MGQDAALGSLSAAGLTRPARAQQAVPRGTQEFAAQGLHPKPGHSDGTRRAGAPNTGRRRPPSAGTEPGGTARSPSWPPALAAEPAPELRASLAGRLGCPGAPSSHPGVGELRLAEKLPSRPVPDARSEGTRRRRRKTQRRGHCLGCGSRLSETLPKPGPAAAAATRPAGGTVSGRGAVARLGGGLGEPQGPGSRSYLGESPEHQVSDSRQLSVPSCRCRACPTVLSPSVRVAGLALHIRPAPRPRLSPRPLRLLPPPPRGSGGGGRAAEAQHPAPSRTWSSCRPRPGPNQASSGGVQRVPGGRKLSIPRLRVLHKDAVLEPRRSKSFPHHGNSGARGHCQLSHFLA